MSEKRKFTKRASSGKANSSDKSRATKGKKNYKEAQDREMDYSSSEELVRSNRTNDPSWYTDSPELLRSISAVSFGNRVGAKVNLDNANITISHDMKHSSTVPGMCALTTLTGPGIATNSTDAVNLAARDIYAYIRTYVTTSQDYDPADVMMYLLAMDEIFMAYYDAVRAYGAMTLYNKQSTYVPRDIISALGWDFDDLSKNRAQFLTAINMMVVRMTNFVVPKVLTLYTRHAWLYSNLFTDANSAKAQLYFFKPYGYRIFDEVSSETGGYLQWKAAPAKKTVDWFIQQVDELVGPLAISDSMMRIESDILKAYPNSDLIQIGTIPMDYAVPVVFDEMVLSQIENATSMGTPKNPTTTCNIVQNPEINESTIIYSPDWDMSAWSNARVNNPILSDKILNAHVQDVSPEWIMEATRLMNIPVVNKTDDEFYLESGGAEVVISCDMYVMKADQSGCEVVGAHYNDVFGYNNTALVKDSIGTIKTQLNTFAVLSKFDWHPFCSWYGSNSDNADQNEFYYFFELDNYAIMSSNTLSNLHTYAMLNLFDVGGKYHR